MNQAEFDAEIQRIRSHAGVQDVIVSSPKGHIHFTTMDDEKTLKFVEDVNQLEKLSNGLVRDLDPSNSLTTLRIQTDRKEILVSSDATHKLIVVQQPPYDD